MLPTPSADRSGVPDAAGRPLVSGLDDPRAGDPALTGAKAAALATAARAGLLVLPGVVVTTAAVEELAAGEPFSQAVLDAWRAVSEDDALSLVVRSSSTVEDLGESSMAGRFESVVGVRGLGAFAVPWVW